MNKQKLKSFMSLFGDTQASLAEYLGISKVCLNRKINSNGSSFTQPEICNIKQRYNLTNDDIISIFFVEKVS